MMKELNLPSLKKIEVGINNIIEVNMVDDNHFYPLWHFHPQYEIMHIKQSIGNRYVGDNVSTFSAGDILFFGPNIPHLLRNYREYFAKDSTKRAKATVLYFSEEFTKIDFFSLNELMHIKKLLNLSSRGLLIQGEASKKVGLMIIRFIKKKGFYRLLEFIKMLHFISMEVKFSFLSSEGFNMKIDDN